MTGYGGPARRSASEDATAEPSRPSRAPDGRQSTRLLRLRAIASGAIVVLAGSALALFIRTPEDGLAVIQGLAVATLVVALLLQRTLGNRLSAGRDVREAGLTRMLQGMSRSISSEAIVITIVEELRRAADADHVIVSRLRPVDRIVETTLVSTRAMVPPSRSILPVHVLDPTRVAETRRTRAAVAARRGQRPEQVVADELASRVAETYGLSRTLAAPLVADARIVGALILSRQAEREWADEDRRLLTWSAQELSAALVRAYAFEEAENRANLDALTGLPNRRYLEELLAEVGPHRRAGDRLGALMIDIDHFKRLNDRHGHATGDRVLHAVGQVISGAVRLDDTPARYGGEEFAVVLRRANAQQALEVAERIRHSIAAIPVEELGTRYPITVSVGVAVADSSETEIGTLLNSADAALYRAKHEGRNRVVLA